MKDDAKVSYSSPGGSTGGEVCRPPSAACCECVFLPACTLVADVVLICAGRVD